jgi:hypothetical protein
MTTPATSRLTETEKTQIRYWIHTIGSDLVAADTRSLCRDNFYLYCETEQTISFVM